MPLSLTAWHWRRNKTDRPEVLLWVRRELIHYRLSRRIPCCALQRYGSLVLFQIAALLNAGDDYRIGMLSVQGIEVIAAAMSYESAAIRLSLGPVRATWLQGNCRTHPHNPVVNYALDLLQEIQR